MDDEEIPDLVDVSQTDGTTTTLQDGPDKKVPITIITGYLGAGKTTLLNYILTAEHGKKIAVILNGMWKSPLTPLGCPERPTLSCPFLDLQSLILILIANVLARPAEFGNTTDIEKSLTVTQNHQATTEWIPLANGCICCSVKDSGVAALESLVERQKDFDYILLETTGVADPGNIAPMFWLDDGLGSSIYLDGIVTVVDAKNILKSLDEPAPEELPQSETAGHDHSLPLLTTAHLQISHADVIILNKTDLVSPARLSAVQARIASINSLARIVPTVHSRVTDLSGTILDLKAYSTFPSGSATSDTSDKTIPDFASKGHSHLDPTLSTATFTLPPFDPQKLHLLSGWLEALLWDAEESQQGRERQYEIHRTKGLVKCTDGSARVIQGVREIFEIIDLPHPETGGGSLAKEAGEEVAAEEGKIVFIGRNLDLITGLKLDEHDDSA
ncbi:COBW domain-containing protein 1 [Fonsecaea pedrosoi]|nr:COBW domain-containing protein 1 [Fonsecaea pedrosoi]